MEGDFINFGLKPKKKRKIWGAGLIVEKKRFQPLASSELLIETTGPKS